MYLILGYSAVATVFFILMYLVGRHNQLLKRYSKEEPDPDKATMSTEEDHVMNTYL